MALSLAGEITLKIKGINKMDQYQTTTKHKKV